MSDHQVRGPLGLTHPATSHDYDVIYKLLRLSQVRLCRTSNSLSTNIRYFKMSQTVDKADVVRGLEKRKVCDGDSPGYDLLRCVVLTN
jgi:hypothetical protein